jgi:transposase InsO family protein
MGEAMKAALRAQYADHRSWSYQLHHDNLRVLAGAEPALAPAPSYATLRRYMKATGLLKGRRVSARDTDGARRAQRRLDELEVRSYEAEYVNGLWHLDFHVGSLPVLTPTGEWKTPELIGVLDDRSRLGCHAQWYFGESAQTVVHGLSQAFQKRKLPGELMSDRGAAEMATEVTQGLSRLGTVHTPTLEYSPYQNGKQESFWGQVEGRLLAMLENCKDLTLELLNEATLAWLELEYNRAIHSEIGQTPLSRFLAGPDVGRPCPSSDELRLAFTGQERRTQRRSDGTLSLEGRRFEIPSRYRHLERITVRWARWDLGHVWMADERTGKVLCRLFPLDRTRNASGERRTLEPIDGTAGIARAELPPPQPGIAPLLKKLMAEYRATGLPPAYVPLTTALAHPDEENPT